MGRANLVTNGASDHSLYIVAGVMILVLVGILVVMLAQDVARWWSERRGEE